MSATATAPATHPSSRALLQALRASRHGALAVGLLLTLLGTTAALVGAGAVAHSEDQQSRLADHLTSAGVASTLKLALLHEEDLIVSASAFMSANPVASPAQFDRWAASVGAMRRYPELQNVGLVKLVPASGLGAFEAHVSAEPLRPFGASAPPVRGPFAVIPPGQRPAYCFAAAGLARSRGTFLPQSLDYCALAPTLLATRDTGKAEYAPFVVGSSRMLGVETPVYRNGSAPLTVGARRRAFLGWLGVLLAPEEVLARAREGHPFLALRFKYDRGGQRVTFTSGTIPDNAESNFVDLHNGWTVQSLTVPPARGVIGNWRARLMLVGGTLLSALIGMLVFTLASGRRRALELVAEKTRELSYAALHDPLTGLANRALLLESAERMLSRVDRTPGLGVNALFIDIDGFKEINDTLGHAAGDELLQVLAGRLRETIRASDVAARLGGDEFVVLAEIEHAASPNVLPERIVARLREPIELDQGRKVVAATVSVGVAVGEFAHPSELLRLADLALYEAKAAGKDGYVVFDAAVQGDLHALFEHTAHRVAHPHARGAGAHPVAGIT
ncbi:MAG TPA: sensor domain-containing diguanylate cyclase [Solirubrobacteraceae bacterium]|nr:sensor domain-containing diguanylate cyclase [Solirubrobacteraceae bacterium]